MIAEGHMEGKQCPEMRRCQTHASAYIAGKHPEGENV